MTSAPPEDERLQPVSARGLAGGALAMALSNVAKVGLQLALLPIMARLLGPEEFGLYWLALPTVIFLLMLADGGLGSSLARESDRSGDTWSSAFWALQATSLVLAVGVIGWSFLLAAASQQPRLPPVMAALSLTLILLGLTVLPSARLVQQGRIGAAGVADLAGNIIGAVVGVAMALSGAGAWSLVGQYLLIFASRMVILNLLAPFRPRLVFHLQPLLPHLLVGGGAVGVRLADFAGRLIENAAVSRFAGGAALGAYTLSNQAPRMICEGVSNPVWATLFVRALSEKPAALANIHERLTRLLALALLPVSFVTAAAASQWVGILLGDDWAPAGPMLAILLPTYALAVVTSQGNAILYAKGRTRVQLGLSAAWAGLRVLALLLTPWIGLELAVAAVGAANLAYAAAGAAIPAKILGLSRRRLFGAVAMPLVAATLAAIACWALLPLSERNVLVVLAYQAGALALYAAIAIGLQPRRFAEDVQAVYGLIRSR